MDQKRTFDQTHDGMDSNPLSNILNVQLPNANEIDSTINTNGESAKRIKTNPVDNSIGLNTSANAPIGNKYVV